jgi:flavin reductase (DIM6/NTAB) family NADH-FMN oxidoreductase RutF
VSEATRPDSAAFRRAMSLWATGVGVVTTRGPDGDHGLTVNAFLSVTLEPPTVLISVGDEATSSPTIRETRRFALSVLRADQADISVRMATGREGRPKFEGLPLRRSTGGLAWIEGALVRLECEVKAEYRAADHWLFLGEVVALETGPDGLPLVFYRSRYGEPVGPDQVRLPLRKE